MFFKNRFKHHFCLFFPPDATRRAPNDPQRRNRRRPAGQVDSSQGGRKGGEEGRGEKGGGEGGPRERRENERRRGKGRRGEGRGGYYPRAAAQNVRRFK